MIKCEKCGKILDDQDAMVWKCNKCGNVVKVSMTKLYGIYKSKMGTINIDNRFFGCPSCGYGMDDWNEKIACKCSSCGNAVVGNLRYFMGDENSTDFPEFNTSTFVESDNNLGILSEIVDKLAHINDTIVKIYSILNFYYVLTWIGIIIAIISLFISIFI